MNLLLVDGYNVIRCTPPYRELADEDLSAARTALVNDVAGYAGGEWDATIVFDGAGNPHSDGAPHRIAGMTVIFSRYGTSADSVIESLSREARARGERVEVVTSDAQTQWAVLGGTVVRRSAAEFSRDLRDDEAARRERSTAGSPASRIEDRIDPKVREVLERWSRGQR